VRVVGIGQRGARHAAAKTHVVEFAAQRSQAGFDIAKTVAVSQLRKGHRQILIPTREASQPRIAAVARHTAPELAVRQEADQLREDGSALVHAPLLPACKALSKAESSNSQWFAVQIAASQMRP
jgi:hypothetical protein